MDYQDGYRSQQSWVESDAGSPQPSKSWLPTCLIGCLGVLFLVAIVTVVGGYLAYTRGPTMMAEFVHTQMVDVVRQSELPAEEKDAITHELDRVIEAFRNGEVALEDLQAAIDDLMESPLLGAGVLMAVEVQYLDPSGLSDEEKDQAKRALQRVWRGFVEETIDADSLKPALEIIADEDSNGTWKLRNEVSDEELRQFIAQTKAIADEHEIPDEPFEISISNEVKKLVDNILGPEGVQAEDSQEELTEFMEEHNGPSE